jgi:hypothetical protein
MLLLVTMQNSSYNHTGTEYYSTEGLVVLLVKKELDVQNGFTVLYIHPGPRRALLAACHDFNAVQCDRRYKCRQSCCVCMQ